MAGMKEVHIVTCITMDHQHPRVLYAGTTGGTYRSEDGGTTWQKKNSGLIPDDVLNAAMALGVNVLAVDPRNSEIVYAATTKGLFRSTNRAEYWEQIGQGLSNQFISTLVLHPTDLNIFYIGGPDGVHKTFDGGKTWQPHNQGLSTLNVRTISHQHERSSAALSRHQWKRVVPIDRRRATLGADSAHRAQPSRTVAGAQDRRCRLCCSYDMEKPIGTDRDR